MALTVPEVGVNVKVEANPDDADSEISYPLGAVKTKSALRPLPETVVV